MCGVHLILLWLGGHAVSRRGVRNDGRAAMRQFGARGDLAGRWIFSSYPILFNCELEFVTRLLAPSFLRMRACRQFGLGGRVAGVISKGEEVL